MYIAWTREHPAITVEPGDLVGLMLPNTPAFAIAFYGIMYHGAVAVPLDPRRFVLDLNGAPAVVHQPSAVVGRAALGLSLRF